MSKQSKIRLTLNTNQTQSSPPINPAVDLTLNEPPEPKAKARTKGSQKKMKQPSFSVKLVWLKHGFKLMPFDLSKLPNNAAREIDESAHPQHMRQCLAHSVSEVPGHPEYSSAPSKTRNADDRLHYEKFHPTICSIMDQISKDEDPHQAFSETLKFMVQKFEKRGLLHYFIRTGLTAKHINSLAFLVLFLDAEIPLSVIDHDIWQFIMEKVLGIDVFKRTTLTKLLEIMYEYVKKKREETIEDAGFFHTLFDFYNCMGRELLLINYQTLINKEIVQFPLDIIPFPGRQFALSIAKKVEACVKSHTKGTISLQTHN
jgi:hypothetical protein